MIYGRRFFEKSNTKVPAPDAGKQWKYRKGGVHLLYKNFQLKYTLYLLAAVAGAILIFTIPSWYFIQQNYQVFYSLAYDTQPQLLDHLEREVTWLGFFFAFSQIATVGFCFWVGLKITGSIIGPIWALERHMKKITLGDWAAEDFRIRAGDDFRSLANSYSYLYRSLRAQTEADIRMLEKMVIDPKDHETFSTWQSLLSVKRSQLGWPDASTETSDANAASTSSSQPSRRAS